MRAVHAILALGVAAALSSGCGEETGAGTGSAREPVQPPRTVHVSLDGDPSPENVGILMAQRRGFFRDVGLEVSVSPPEKPSRPIRYVLERWVDISISHEPQLVLARGKNLPVVAVGSLVPQPTAAMIWLRRSKIDDISDLEDKTIAIPGLSFQRKLLRSVLKRAGLRLDDVKVKRVGYDLVSALVRGRTDAIFGGSWNVEGAEVEARGLEPVVTRVQSLGIPSYDELVVVVRRDRLARDPQMIRDFMSAVARGTAAAIEDPQAAADAIVDVSFYKRPKAAEIGVEATLPLLSRRGYMSAGEAGRLVEWMRGEGLIQREVAASALFTNRYLNPAS